MIIRMTVNDNDFGYVLDRMMAHFYHAVTDAPYIGIEIGKSDFEATSKALDEVWRLNSIMNPNNDDPRTKEDLEFLVENVKKAFNNIVDKSSEEDSTKDYLKRNLKVEILTSVEDKWENGEAYYWFQHSGKYISQ